MPALQTSVTARGRAGLVLGRQAQGLAAGLVWHLLAPVTFSFIAPVKRGHGSRLPAAPRACIGQWQVARFRVLGQGHLALRTARWPEVTSSESRSTPGLVPQGPSVLGPEDQGQCLPYKRPGSHRPMAALFVCVSRNRSAGQTIVCVDILAEIGYNSPAWRQNGPERGGIGYRWEKNPGPQNCSRSSRPPSMVALHMDICCNWLAGAD